MIIVSFSLNDEVKATTTCGEAVSYGGLSYDTVQIGTQCWFKQNLNVGAMIMNLEVPDNTAPRSEEHTSELQSHSFISYAVFCLKKKKKKK